MNNLLNEKTIFIAGAAGLLGSELVRRCLQQGAKVIAADINITSLLDTLKRSGISTEDNEHLQLYSLDITAEKLVKSFFNDIGKLDGAVNLTYPRNRAYGTHFLDVSLSDFNENLSLHLGSSFLFIQQCAKYFINHQTPFSLVNISSIYGTTPPKFEIYDKTTMTMPVEYAAIKSALIHLSKYASSYIKNSKFRVNCVSPGGILDQQPEEFLDAYKAHTHGEGMLTAEKVVGAIIFLLSDQSEYITGQNIVVDDGFSL